ncbi:Mannose-1-phosphate guanylyltransferase / Mannose-6-phosphate isomerase [hydrothermal vent metagenome]|uniref:mannose-1-phosphate guanylyltransferase n=1 Tax=hydrothermal vent metagenome TaxID=652676 RepID=A0A3B0Y2M5_9ZZZZ
MIKVNYDKQSIRTDKATRTNKEGTGVIIPVILSGGSGTRLWPVSRALRPKQLLPLVGDLTMIQETVTRLNGIDNLGSALIVCNEAHRFMIAEQMRECDIEPSGIILEPFARNTAPAVAVSAVSAMSQSAQQDVVILVLPADHVIQNIPAFHQAVNSAYKAAMEGKLVTFGIIPNAAQTGYGYIKAGESLENHSAVKMVEQFVEKPDKHTAQSYIEQGSYYWNSGMFMFKASSYLEELARFNPDMLAASSAALEHASTDLDFIRLDSSSFEKCPSDSIDYAVMEKTDKAVVLPVDIGWNDIGSWTALWEVGKSDSAGNVTHGDVCVVDSKNNYIHSESRLVSVVGVEDHVIVETPDAVLVAHKDAAQNVKDIVETLKATGREEALVPHKVYRPWGTYECIDSEERHQAKRIMVKPGGRLSLQLHHHRAEHWIVVKGTAKVTCGEKEFIMSENESTYIPLGEKHRLENTGKIPLEIIEVQTGSYLGEDDIVRFDDVYGREDK